METIQDMENYILSRKRKGKTPKEVQKDLIDHGYDQFAAQGLTLRYWYVDEEGDSTL